MYIRHLILFILIIALVGCAAGSVNLDQINSDRDRSIDKAITTQDDELNKLKADPHFKIISETVKNKYIADVTRVNELWSKNLTAFFWNTYSDDNCFGNNCFGNNFGDDSFWDNSTQQITLITSNLIIAEKDAVTESLKTSGTKTLRATTITNARTTRSEKLNALLKPTLTTANTTANGSQKQMGLISWLTNWSWLKNWMSPEYTKHTFTTTVSHDELHPNFRWEAKGATAQGAEITALTGPDDGHYVVVGDSTGGIDIYDIVHKSTYGLKTSNRIALLKTTPSGSFIIAGNPAENRIYIISLKNNNPQEGIEVVKIPPDKLPQITQWSDISIVQKNDDRNALLLINTDTGLVQYNVTPSPITITTSNLSATNSTSIIKSPYRHQLAIGNKPHRSTQPGDQQGLFYKGAVFGSKGTHSLQISSSGIPEWGNKTYDSGYLSSSANGNEILITTQSHIILIDQNMDRALWSFATTGQPILPTLSSSGSSLAVGDTLGSLYIISNTHTSKPKILLDDTIRGHLISISQEADGQYTAISSDNGNIRGYTGHGVCVINYQLPAGSHPLVHIPAQTSHLFVTTVDGKLLFFEFDLSRIPTTPATTATTATTATKIHVRAFTHSGIPIDSADISITSVDMTPDSWIRRMASRMGYTDNSNDNSGTHRNTDQGGSALFDADKKYYYQIHAYKKDVIDEYRHHAPTDQALTHYDIIAREKIKRTVSINTHTLWGSPIVSTMISIQGLTLTDTPITDLSQQSTTDTNGGVIFEIGDAPKYKITAFKANEIDKVVVVSYNPNQAVTYCNMIGNLFISPQATQSRTKDNNIKNIQIHIATRPVNVEGKMVQEVNISYSDPSRMTSKVEATLGDYVATDLNSNVFGKTNFNPILTVPSDNCTKQDCKLDIISYDAPLMRTLIKRSYSIRFQESILEPLGFDSFFIFLIGAFILFLVGMVFTATSVEMGALVVCFTGWLLYACGFWVYLNDKTVLGPVSTVLTLSFCTVLSVFALIRIRGRKEGFN